LCGDEYAVIRTDIDANDRDKRNTGVEGKKGLSSFGPFLTYFFREWKGQAKRDTIKKGKRNPWHFFQRLPDFVWRWLTKEERKGTKREEKGRLFKWH